MRVWATNCLVIALALGFLTHFVLLMIHGELLIGEPSLVVLWLEIFLMVGIICFAVLNMIREVK